MSRFIIESTPIAGVKVLQRQPHADSRGTFTRLFCAEELGLAGWDGEIVQINHSVTNQAGCVRGMHFQSPPYADKKLVTCLAGRVWDVAVDLRPDSATFLCWFAQELSAVNYRAMLLPEGVAHGFQALEQRCELVYLHSAAYAPQCEGGVHPLDPRLAIPWPLPIAAMSDKDSQRVWLDESFTGVVL